MSSNGWQNKKVKKSPVKKDKDEIPNQLSEIFKQNYCVYFMMGKCNNGSRCMNIHMSENVLFEKLQRIIMDPTQIPKLMDNRSIISKYVLKNTDVKEYGKPPFLTSCWYSLRNMDCNNMKKGRYTIYNFNFDGEEVPLHICYPEKHTCKTRVTCGLHFDIKFKYIDNVFMMEQLLNPDIPQENNNQISEMTEIKEKELDPKDKELLVLQNIIQDLREELVHTERKCKYFKDEYLLEKRKRDQLIFVPDEPAPKKKYVIDPYMDMSSQDESDSFESEDELDKARKYWQDDPDYENDEDFANDMLYGGKQYEEVF